MGPFCMLRDMASMESTLREMSCEMNPGGLDFLVNISSPRFPHNGDDFRYDEWHNEQTYQLLVNCKLTAAARDKHSTLLLYTPSSFNH